MEDRKLFKLLFVSWIVLEVCICVCVCGGGSFISHSCAEVGFRVVFSRAVSDTRHFLRHLNASPIDGDKTAPFLHFFC